MTGPDVGTAVMQPDQHGKNPELMSQDLSEHAGKAHAYQLSEPAETRSGLNHEYPDEDASLSLTEEINFKKNSS